MQYPGPRAAEPRDTRSHKGTGGREQYRVPRSYAHQQESGLERMDRSYRIIASFSKAKQNVFPSLQRRGLEIGHLCGAWSKNSPPRLGGVPRAINSSLEASGGVVDQRREATLQKAREANRIKKEGFASIYKEGFASIYKEASQH